MCKYQANQVRDDGRGGREIQGSLPPCPPSTRATTPAFALHLATRRRCAQPAAPRTITYLPSGARATYRAQTCARFEPCPTGMQRHLRAAAP